MIQAESCGSLDADGGSRFRRRHEHEIYAQTGGLVVRRISNQRFGLGNLRKLRLRLQYLS